MVLDTYHASLSTANSTSRSPEEDDERVPLAPQPVIPSSSSTLLSTIGHLILFDLLGVKDPGIKRCFSVSSFSEVLNLWLLSLTSFVRILLYNLNSSRTPEATWVRWTTNPFHL
ncbi:hypothetical protein GYMLUDRAFT_701507 [Collybiopsis luxurians FD-317 M1]|uniref:Uncharacterized protein n=1 Tax=Collybiopsis luxurians FD-317 M1 TaxID=944289 RepID=A0A0D0B4M7_9AGAR|nr:hypothetical protein GYMLUDRAFT_701507 [Collybiopsis luxurians FD-317 M1]